MVIVTIGANYQIVIPKEIREKMPGIKPGAKMSISVEDGVIILRLVK